MTETERLALQLRDGSRKAFDQLYHLFFPELYAYCLKCCKSTEAAEEIVQDTFVQLWVKRTEIREAARIRHLLIVMAHNKLINAMRYTASSPDYECFVDYNNQLASPAEGDLQLEYEEFLVRLRQALDELPATQRQVVELSRLKGMHNDEIARTIGRSEQTVRNQLSLALKTLRKRLAGHVPLAFLALLLG